MESFCIYCQKEYGTPNKLDRHLLKAHKDSIRANRIVKCDTDNYMCILVKGHDGDHEDLRGRKFTNAGYRAGPSKGNQ